MGVVSWCFKRYTKILYYAWRKWVRWLTIRQCKGKSRMKEGRKGQTRRKRSREDGEADDVEQEGSKCMMAKTKERRT